MREKTGKDVRSCVLVKMITAIIIVTNGDNNKKNHNIHIGNDNKNNTTITIS